MSIYTKVLKDLGAACLSFHHLDVSQICPDEPINIHLFYKLEITAAAGHFSDTSIVRLSDTLNYYKAFKNTLKMIPEKCTSFLMTCLAL